MEIKIREIKEGDFDYIKSLLENQGLSLEIPRKTFSNLLKRNKGFYLVAQSPKGQVIGSIFGTHDGGYLGYIYKLVVDKKFQRQKIATTLVNELLKRFKKQGIDWVFAHVRKVNKDALSLFKTLGFEAKRDIFLIDNWKE